MLGTIPLKYISSSTLEGRPLNFFRIFRHKHHKKQTNKQIKLLERSVLMVGQVYACFQNPGLIMVFFVASGFGMLFYRGADIPIHCRLVLSGLHTANLS